MHLGTGPGTAYEAGQVFIQGLGYLHGAEGVQDFDMAAARLHQAAEMGLAAAHMYCALLHYCGVGAARSLPRAVEHVVRYLVAEPSGTFALVARDLAAGSLGADNARRLLFDGGSRPAAGGRVAGFTARRGASRACPGPASSPCAAPG